MKQSIGKYYCLLTLLLLTCSLKAQRASTDDLWNSFLTPPDETRTKVWWFHGETETTREGITADLEAFRKVGIGGVVYYDQVHGPATDALDVFSPEWWQMFVFAASEARRLGLTFETHVSNGYVAGGPWITPELGMQMLVTTDTVITGGRRFRGSLPRPRPVQGYAGDVAVLAFPVPEGRWRSLPPICPEGYLSLMADTAHYLFLDCQEPFTARSVSYRAGKRGKATTSATNVPGPPADGFVGTGYVPLPDMGDLEVSDDGKHYQRVCGLPPIYNAHGSWNRKTISFPPVTGRHFRLRLHDWWTEADRKKPLRIGDIRLSSKACVTRWEEKAGLVSEYIDSHMDTPAFPTDDCIRSADIIDLTSRFRPLDSFLDWQVPPGHWVVMRFAHVPTGAKTKHGRHNLTGLECDKMSRRAAEAQWNNYYKVMSDTLAHYNLHIDGLAMDSHEAGSQNWTEGFERQFLSRRGYSLLPYLPAMTGYVVDSSARSDSVLADVRRTIADLVADEYYGALDSLCRTEGIPFTAQAIGNALCLVGDLLQAKGKVGKPQGEFWAIHPDGNYDIKEASSAAHLYGKPIASGEAFTDAKFGQPLSYLKQLADGAYCYGLNEFVVCASAYQPWTDRVPGSTGGGRHYCLNRNNTYWPLSGPFWLYQARCTWMMRAGKSVNDLCIYLGENAPVKILTYRLPELPSGYDFDAFSSDALFHRMQASRGRIVLPDGMSYGAVVVPRRTELTEAARQRLREMQTAGVPVWYEGSQPLAEFLISHHLLPDVSMFHHDMKQQNIWFAHRQTPTEDIYFLNNHGEETTSDHFLFRNRRRHAQWWDATTGRRWRLAVQPDGSVPLLLQGKEAGFVVWSDEDATALPLRETAIQAQAITINGPWTVVFDTRMGGPASIPMDSLTDWRLHADPAVRHYSGQACYSTTFSSHVPKPDERVRLRFTQLADMARIEVNGQDAGIVWCSPWEADITDFLCEGQNTLHITVVNSLVNRMVGDASLPAGQRVTFAYPSIVTANDPLLPSGIIGPISLVTTHTE